MTTATNTTNTTNTTTMQPTTTNQQRLKQIETLILPEVEAIALARPGYDELLADLREVCAHGSPIDAGHAAGYLRAAYRFDSGLRRLGDSPLKWAAKLEVYAHDACNAFDS